ncbi:MAG TPA: hypothetical protein CFH84_02660 [Sulfurimonas sp. UBA12504]|nr:MAG TPA: hypothetical protein CFH84_02660 [Sulfurimonas sp. UBA12504]
MLSAFQTGLIEHINLTHTCKEYFGELSDKSRLKMVKNDLPMVLVDFVSSDAEDAYAEAATFNLYILHATYSKNEELRSKTNLSLLDFIHSIKRLIVQQSFGYSSPIEIKKTKKMIDAAVDGAYLSVYTMSITATIYDTQPLQEGITE